MRRDRVFARREGVGYARQVVRTRRRGAVHARRGLVSRFADDVPILAKLPPEELFAVAEKMREATFAPGQTIMTQGDRADYFYVLEEGAAKATVRLRGEPEPLVVARYARGVISASSSFWSAGGPARRPSPPSRTVGAPPSARTRFWNSSPRARNSDEGSRASVRRTSSACSARGKNPTRRERDETRTVGFQGVHAGDCRVR